MTTVHTMQRSGRPEVLAAALVLLLGLNVFDLFNTVFMINAGLAHEVNPIMKWAFSEGWKAVFMIKVLFPVWMATWFWIRKLPVVALVPVLGMYLALVTYQVYQTLQAAPLILALVRSMVNR